MKLGIKLIKIHKILSFKQKIWLKVFTDFNTRKRQESNDEFNKNLHKLLIIVSMEKALRSQKIIDKNVVAVHCGKKYLA